MTFTLLETITLLLLLALIATVSFRYLRLPSILGYLLVGVLIGQHMLGWQFDLKNIKELAEFGVAFLMFTIGLEFSLSRLIVFKKTVFLLGSLQVLFTIIITAIIGILLQMTLMESIIVGAIAAMSSTAIVARQLKEQFEINSIHGLNAIGILLFQDLAVIPLLVLFANLSGSTIEPFITTLGWSLLKALLAIFIILTVGRFLLRPLFHLIAKTQIIELFTLSTLFVVVGSAWVTQSLGISYALGTFLAGIMLGETEYQHQINAEIRPFRDVLLGIFFISIGMLANVTLWFQAWVWILLLLTAVMLGKTILIIILCKLSNVNMVSSARTGLILAQGGEFGFALLSLATANHLLPKDYGQVVLAALLISFALAPIIIRYNLKIAQFFVPKTLIKKDKEIKIELEPNETTLKEHVIICGYGRVGQNIAHFLNKFNYPYVGLDLDPEIIHNAKLAGDKVVYGDATNQEILKAVNVSKAKVIVISFNNIFSALELLSYMQRNFSKIPVMVRCKDESQSLELQAHGATKVVTEIFEESLALVNHLLHLIHIPPTKIDNLLKEVRHKNYGLLYQVFPGSFTEESTKECLHEYLRPILLLPDAYANGHSINELALQNIEIIAIRRGKHHIKPRIDTKLLEGDTLVLFGLPNYLEEAENKLLLG